MQLTKSFQGFQEVVRETFKNIFVAQNFLKHTTCVYSKFRFEPTDLMTHCQTHSTRDFFFTTNGNRLTFVFVIEDVVRFEIGCTCSVVVSK